MRCRIRDTEIQRDVVDEWRLGRAHALREFDRRIENDRDAEFEAALAQIGRITRSRLDDLLAE